ncbi:hypothetical protein ACFO9E_14620 [Streptomyces maoxianensis]|uniref:Excisionase n=1 Tax=Streptomyces maoxianensis TaxID=1459942 RepID=A0ABV9G8W3_9ACTN
MSSGLDAISFTVYDLIRSRRLTSSTIGRARRVPADAVRDFITHEIEAAA